MLPKSDSTKTESPPHVSPEDTVYLKDWKSSTVGVFNPKWKDPYHVTLCTPSAGKLEGPSSWAHISRTKPVRPSQETHERTNLPSYSYEPLDDLDSPSNDGEAGPHHAGILLGGPHRTRFPPPPVTPVEVPRLTNVDSQVGTSPHL